MDFSTVNEFVVNLQDKLQTCWHFYIVVVLGTLGWLYSRDTKLSARQASILTVGLSFFFVVNIWMTLDTLESLSIAIAERNAWIRSGMFKTEGFTAWLNDDSTRAKAHLSWTLHLLVDLVVLRSIWLQIHPARSEGADGKPAEGDKPRLKFAS